MKCAIIDDSKSITMIVSEIIEEFGSTCSIYNNSLIGLEAIKNEKFDLVFLDISMDRITGLEIIENLKTSGKLPNQRIVILSGKSIEKNEQEKLKALGITEIYEKPFSLDVIKRILIK